MANEIQVTYSHLKTLYFYAVNRVGQVWNTLTSAFEAYVSANYADYAVTMAEQGVGSSGLYMGSFPASIPAGVYGIVAKQQLGASVAETDPTVAQGDYQWNGSFTFPLSDITVSGQASFVIQHPKGTALSGFLLDLVSSTDHVTPFVSGIVSGQVSKDGNPFVALQSGMFNEVGLGTYAVSLTSGDLLARMVMLRFTANGVSGGSSDPRKIALLLQTVSGF